MNASIAAPSATARHGMLYLRLVLVSLLWGGTFIAGRILAQGVPPATGSFLRFAVAALTLLAAAWWLEGGLPRLDLRQVLVTFALGATGVFAYNLFFLGALARLPASRTALIIALNPVVTIGLACCLLGERLDRKRWCGLLLALAGVWVIVSRGDITGALSSAVGTGEWLMFGGVCSWAAYTVIGRFSSSRYTPLATTAYACLWGALLLALAALREWDTMSLARLTPRVGLAALYLGALGTALAFVWYSQGIRRIGASRTVIFINLVPVFGAVLGIVLLDEALLPSMVVGGGIAIAGVVLAQTSES